MRRSHRGFDDDVRAARARRAGEKSAAITRPTPRRFTATITARPIGPHPIGMFEVNVFSPEQFGAFVSWLVVWRGPLSALIHPNTGDDVRDHSQRATW